MRTGCLSAAVVVVGIRARSQPFHAFQNRDWQRENDGGAFISGNFGQRLQVAELDRGEVERLDDLDELQAGRRHDLDLPQLHQAAGPISEL